MYNIEVLVHIAYIHQCKKGFEFCQSILLLLAKTWIVFFSEIVCITVDKILSSFFIFNHRESPILGIGLGIFRMKKKSNFTGTMTQFYKA